MRIEYAKYSLNKKISGGSHQSSEGVLFKFNFDDGVGYSLYQPIKSLGDRGISEIITSMSVDKIVDRTCLLIIESAKLIKNFFSERAENILKPIPCYFSAGDIKSFSLSTLKEEVLPHQFKTIKFKVTSLEDIDLEIFKKHDLKVILDFNQLGETSGIENFKNIIKYVEDPPKDFKSKEIPVAKDFDLSIKSPDLIIKKPTGFEKLVFEEGTKESTVLVFTSYLDHPLGQLISALSVTKSSLDSEHGLLTQRFYQKNKYSELISKGPLFKLNNKADFLSLLEYEDWKVL